MTFWTLRTRCGGGRQTQLSQVGSFGRLIRAVETFGFHLATLDLRQNADVHARVVAELLRTAQVESDMALTENDKVALLRRELEVRDCLPVRLLKVQ